MVSKILGSELTTRSDHIFGFRYPGRRGNEEWLILELRCTKPAPSPAGGFVISNEAEKRATFEAGQITCYRVQGARPNEIQLRNTTVVDPAIRGKTVALIGLGSLGSKVAELLAQAGVGGFRICDGDRLSTGNVARHIGGISDFGERKTIVVAKRLNNINPHLRATICHHDSATRSVSSLRAFMDPADLVICTTADENAESAINQIAVSNGKPVIYGRAMRRGSMGRVFLVRPGVDACKRCLGVYAEGVEIEIPEDWIAVTERPEDVLLHECGRPVIPSSAIDLSFVASLIARQALNFLDGKIRDQNHWLWSQEPAPDIDGRLDRPLATVEGTISRFPDCPACSSSTIVRVLLPDNLRDAITKEVLENPEAETGGFLLGYVDGDTANITRVVGPGPNAIKTATRFEKDIIFAQSELDKAATELGAKGQYLGEWHSHLVADPTPSGQDIASLTGIAEAANYPSLCPVMLIAGYDQKKESVATIKVWAFPVSKRIFAVEIVAADEMSD